MLNIDPTGYKPYDFYRHYKLICTDTAPDIPANASDGLLPAIITVNPTDPMYNDDQQLQRTTMFCVTRTPGGRIFMAYFSGGGHADEDVGNWDMIICSDDEGKTFRNIVAINPPNPKTTRVFDAITWLAPDGSLWIFYVQSYMRMDGREGVWYIRCENPDAEQLEFSAPKRIAEGIMPSPPTVLKDGRWMILTYHHDPAAFHGDMHDDFKTTFILSKPENIGIIVNESKDQGQTFAPIASGLRFPFATFFESFLTEKLDGTLWILVRGMNCTGQCFSEDGGHTWTPILVNGSLPLPNTHFHIGRLKSGNLLLIANYKANMFSFFVGRNNLTALISKDDGKTWEGKLLLDEREGAEQPGFYEADNGFIYISYGRAPQYAGETLLAIVTEEDILAGKLVNPASRLKISAGRATGMLYCHYVDELRKIAAQNGIEM